MSIDYLPLMLVNTAAALILAALFLLKGIASDNPRLWVTGFVITGAVAFLGGLHMALTWPLRDMGAFNVRWANVAFGEPSVLFGVVLLGTALSLAKSWSLVPVGVYSLLAGAAAIVIGAKIGFDGLTKAPGLTAAGFILAGLGGALTFVIFLNPRRRPLRILAAGLMLLSAAIWALTAGLAYWGHVSTKFGA